MSSTEQRAMPYQKLRLQEQLMKERGAEGESAMPDNYNGRPSMRQFVELREVVAPMSMNRHQFDEAECAEK